MYRTPNKDGFMNTAPPLQIPDDVVFECLMCGRCCADFYELPLDEASNQRLDTMDLIPMLPTEDRRPPFEASPYREGGRMLRQVQGHCCFMTFQKLCMLHQQLHAEAKPQVCRDFPFWYVETPGGDYVGVSFACTAVLTEKGPAIRERREWLGANRPHSANRRGIRLPIRLGERIPITWEQYLQIESDLLKILNMEFQPLENRLIAQGIYLKLLEDFVRQAHAQGIVTANNAPPSATPASSLPSSAREAGKPPGMSSGVHAGTAGDLEGILDPIPLSDLLLHTFRNQLGTDDWTRLFSLAMKPLEQPLLLRSFLGLLTDFRQAPAKRRSRAATSAFIVSTYARHALRAGSLLLHPLVRAVPWKALRKVRIDFSDPFTAYTAQRYFRHSLERKDLLQEETVRVSHGFLLMHFGLWRYYMSALAALEGLERPEREHVLEALRNVEKYYVFHPVFPLVFTHHPTLRGVVESVMGNPRYAATMTRARL